MSEKKSLSGKHKYFDDFYPNVPRCEFCKIPYENGMHLLRGYGSGGDCWITDNCSIDDLKIVILNSPTGDQEK